MVIPRFSSKNLIALASVCFSTIGIVGGIFHDHKDYLPVLVLIAAVFYATAVFYAFKTKSRFYLSIIALSVIVIINGLLINTSSKEGMMLFVTLFNIVSVTLVIYQLITIQKKWDHEGTGY